MSALQKEMLSKKLPPLMPGGAGFSGATKKLPRGKDMTPLNWSEFFEEQRTVELDSSSSMNVYLRGTSGPVFLLLHGGGYSGLTWSCFAVELSTRIDCRICAPDLRGHGSTVCENEDVLTMQNMAGDVAKAYRSIYCTDGSTPPPCVIIGHSMGGALAVNVVHEGLIPNCVGMGVIDVVEGSAMEALSMMVQFLRSRPQLFATEEEAIVWCLKSGTVRNSKSARVSMPSQIVKREDGKYGWRIDLVQTQQYWVEWFKGLSAKFLSCPPAKVLVLAGTDRLDKELMVGQMQGKFQTTMLPRVGHAVQEDSPDRLADEFARFAVRYNLTQAKSGIQFNSPMC